LSKVYTPLAKLGKGVQEARRIGFLKFFSVSMVVREKILVVGGQERTNTRKGHIEEGEDISSCRLDRNSFGDV
jgi:hypothetical protein